ncbi:MAG: hypothetical protein FH748_08050 [Balneolaceae bacterium]|nr:hypothetical protein [Balneolaceae bacterium]
MALIYIGCSSCKFANNDDVINKVINLKSEFIESFSDHDYSLKLIGISNESDVEAGVEYLQQFGKFDEISVGNEMSNTALQKYVWDYYEGLESGGTPQIIIERRIKSIIRNDPTIAYSSKFDSTEIITRIIGLNPIINFDIVSLEL